MKENQYSDSVLLLGFTAAMMQNASPTMSSAVMDDRHVALCSILYCLLLLLLLLFIILIAVS